MKVLVEKNEDYCGCHSLEHEGTHAQLVILDACADCNPTRSNFLGIESDTVITEAVVMDRPDFDRHSYELTIRSALDDILAPEFQEPSKLKAISRAMVTELLEISDAHKPGSVVVRSFGKYDVYRRRDTN